jgi:hypothetical protein
MTWEIEFSQEASNYAIDSHPYNEAVLIAIERLVLTEDGLPGEGIYQLIENWCVWEVAEHTVVYERISESCFIYIGLIKPSASGL